jgi:hypothetical protein
MEKQARIHRAQRQQWAGSGPWRRGTKLVVVAGSGGSLFELWVVGVACHFAAAAAAGTATGFDDASLWLFDLPLPLLRVM